MRNAGLEEAQAGIKIAGRNINNLRYTDDTTLLAESEEELKTLLKVKEESGGESERGPNQFGRKNEVVFSRWSGNDRHKHFKLWQWMNMYRGKCLLTYKLDRLRHNCYPVV